MLDMKTDIRLDTIPSYVQNKGRGVVEANHILQKINHNGPHSPDLDFRGVQSLEERGVLNIWINYTFICTVFLSSMNSTKHILQKINHNGPH